MDKLLIGKLGETYAEKFLNSNNYRILGKNFRSRFGEIDIIAKDLNNNYELVFIEVKTRTNDVFGAPQEGISAKKLSRIFKTAIYFFNHAPKSRSENLVSTKKLSSHWRIDAIAVKLDHNHRLQTIEHFKNIFNGYG